MNFQLQADLFKFGYDDDDDDGAFRKYIKFFFLEIYCIIIKLDYSKRLDTFWRKKFFSRFCYNKN